MKKSIALTMVALACLAANVQAAEKLAGMLFPLFKYSYIKGTE
jgi:hypothetical protein